MFRFTFSSLHFSFAVPFPVYMGLSYECKLFFPYICLLHLSYSFSFCWSFSHSLNPLPPSPFFCLRTYCNLHYSFIQSSSYIFSCTVSSWPSNLFSYLSPSLSLLLFWPTILHFPFTPGLFIDLTLHDSTHHLTQHFIILLANYFLNPPILLSLPCLVLLFTVDIVFFSLIHSLSSTFSFFSSRAFVVYFSPRNQVSFHFSANHFPVTNINHNFLISWLSCSSYLLVTLLIYDLLILLISCSTYLSTAHLISVISCLNYWCYFHLLVAHLNFYLSSHSLVARLKFSTSHFVY